MAANLHQFTSNPLISKSSNKNIADWSHLSIFAFVVPATYTRVSSEHAHRHHTHCDGNRSNNHLPWVGGAELPMGFECVCQHSTAKRTIDGINNISRNRTNPRCLIIHGIFIIQFLSAKDLYCFIDLNTKS